MKNERTASAMQRVAVVTGGGGGMGLAIARRLTEDGLAVALWDIDEKGISSAVECLPHSLGVHVDVTDERSVANGLARTLDRFGRLDVLVNGAGLVGPIAPVVECDVDAWQRTIDVNLRSVFLCSRAVVEPMLKAEYGRIVNISSVAGKDGNPNWSAYSASKAAVMAFTKSMGKELATSSILVNCITPAVIQTPFLNQLTQEELDVIIAKIPMKRVGKPTEVAAMVSWLSSPECSFTTGACFDLSGGRSTY